MTKSGSVSLPRSEHTHSNHALISSWQRSVELRAMRLRAELNLSDIDPLEHDRALSLIPNCEVWALKNIPGLPFEVINHFRIAGYQLGAFAFKDADGDHRIVFNDSHPPTEVRVHLMEEFFHIRLGHEPDLVRPYPSDGRHRTYSNSKEDEAYGCGIAALVPFGGLMKLLSRGFDLRRVAEHFLVPTDVVGLRIEATQLGGLVSTASKQLSPVASYKRNFE